jgi:hypothetical protein
MNILHEFQIFKLDLKELVTEPTLLDPHYYFDRYILNILYYFLNIEEVWAPP